MGENQIMFHGWPYSPPQTRSRAGMVAYRSLVQQPQYLASGDAGGHRYIGRMSYLLRQGSPPTRLPFCCPRMSLVHLRPWRISVTGAMQGLSRPR